MKNAFKIGEDGQAIDHLDGCKINNTLYNLDATSRRENLIRVMGIRCRITDENKLNEGDTMESVIYNTILLASETLGGRVIGQVKKCKAHSIVWRRQVRKSVTIERLE